jgi:DNA-binding phage protein
MQLLQEVVDKAEKKYLVKLLEDVHNHTVAAQVAGVTRVQLFRLLKKHGIPRNPHATPRSN